MRWWHLDAILQVEQALFGRGSWSSGTFWSELGAPGRHYVVLAADEPSPTAGPGPGDVCGYLGLMIVGGQADIQTVAVAPGQHGKGYGRQLVEYGLQVATGQGASTVMLEVRADNEAALGLYTALGFERIGIRRRYYQPEDVDAIIMRWRLHRAGGPTGDAEPTPGAG